MYSSIRIQGYRGLDSFRMQGLGRVNLLVGTNNCGKTSILECIELLRSAADPHALWAIATRRGEWAHIGEGDSRASLGPRPDSLDVSHLFANHELRGTILIEADRAAGAAVGGWNDKVTVYLESRSGSQLDEQDDGMEGGDDAPLVLHVRWSEAHEHFRGRVTDEGFLSTSQIRRYLNLARSTKSARARNGSDRSVQFVRTSGLTAADVVRAFSKFVLTPTEDAVTQALRIVEPAVERIAPILDDRIRANRHAPGGVMVKLREAADRVPIGSMGDGMWRMLGLALSIANAEGGVLIVDEIDTGLHYSVMEDMWLMLSEAASALSVQVFATTHSRDCWESLAPIAKSETGDVTIQRIDRSRGEAVRFSRDAIVAAAERGNEVR